MRDHAEGPAALGRDDLAGGERAGDHDDGNDGEQQRQLVADELGQRAHGGQQRVLVVAGPAGHEDRELGRGASREEVEQGGVELDRDHVPAEGQNGEAEERERHDDHRGEGVQEPVGGGGDDVLLGKRLDGVGERLGEAPQLQAAKPREPGAVRAEPILEPAQQFPLGDGGEGEEKAENRENGADGDEVVHPPLQRRGKEMDDPVAHRLGCAFEEGSLGREDHGIVAAIPVGPHLAGGREQATARALGSTQGRALQIGMRPTGRHAALMRRVAAWGPVPRAHWLG